MALKFCGSGNHVQKLLKRGGRFTPIIQIKDIGEAVAPLGILFIGYGLAVEGSVALAHVETGVGLVFVVVHMACALDRVSA